MTVHVFGNVLGMVDYFRFGRRRGGCFIDDVFGGIEAGGVGGVGVGKDRVDGGEGVGDMIFGFFTDEDGLVVLRLGEGLAEGERGLTPIGDGVAVDGGGFGGRFHGGATDDGGKDLLLCRREVVSEENLLLFLHFASF